MKYIILILTVLTITLQASAQQYRTDISMGEQIKNASYPGAVKKETQSTKQITSTSNNATSSQTQETRINNSYDNKNNDAKTNSVKSTETVKLASDRPVKKSENHTIVTPYIPSQSNNESQ